jgi:hypothetical protein
MPMVAYLHRGGAGREWPSTARRFQTWLGGALLGLSCMLAGHAFAGQADDFEHLYSELLQRYWRPAVTIHGIRTTVFDYAQMAKDAQAPESLFRRTLAALEHADPATLWDANQAKAFWINAYNLGAMRLVVDHYPVDSIRSLKISLLKYPSSKDAVRIDGRNYSLREIEKDILLQRFHDPRVVFAVSCAAVSCPDRTADPFSASHLDKQLDALIAAFPANPTKGMHLDKVSRTLTLSWIFQQDRDLFPEARGGIVGFILPYVDSGAKQWLQENPVKIRFFEHDWALNDLAPAGPA